MYFWLRNWPCSPCSKMLLWTIRPFSVVKLRSPFFSLTIPPHLSAAFRCPPGARSHSLLTFASDSQSPIHPNPHHHPGGHRGPFKQNLGLPVTDPSLSKAFPPTALRPSLPMGSCWITSFCRNCSNDHVVNIDILLPTTASYPSILLIQ